MSYTLPENKNQKNLNASINKDMNLKDINQFIGFTLGEAVKLISESGYSVESISVTSPPKLGISEYDSTFRVLRVNYLEEGKLALLVCKPIN